jgi:hypothetical protein
MRRMLILILVPLGWALPASAQNSPPDRAAQQAPACQAPSGQSTGQNIRSDLARSGYSDIQMVPESFVVRAKDPTGASVMTVLSPSSITVVTEATPAEQLICRLTYRPVRTPLRPTAVCSQMRRSNSLEPSLRSILPSMWPHLEQGRIELPAYSRRFG